MKKEVKTKLERLKKKKLSEDEKKKFLFYRNLVLKALGEDVLIFKGKRKIDHMDINELINYINNHKNKDKIMKMKALNKPKYKYKKKRMILKKTRNPVYKN